MTISTTVKEDAGNDLATTNTIVAQQEGVHGALTGMGNDGSSSTLTFDNTPKKPAKNAVVAAQKNGQPVIPQGSTLVCTGTIFVSGTLTLCAATRPA